MQPHGQQPIRLLCPQDSPGKNTGVGCYFLLHIYAQCVQLFVTPWIVAHQAPLSMEFSRQAYWSGLLFPTPGDLSDSRTEPASLVSCIGRQIFATVPSRQNYAEKITARADLCLIFSEGDRWGPNLCSCHLKTCKSIPPLIFSFCSHFNLLPQLFSMHCMKLTWILEN